MIGAGGHRDHPDHARPHPLAGGTLLGGILSLGGTLLGGTPHLRHLVVVYARRALSEALAVAAS